MSAASPVDATTAVVLADLAVVLACATLFGRLAQRWRQPDVVGEIIAGIILGPSLMGLLPGHLTQTLFPPDVRPYLSVLSQLGLVLFMFGVGYEMDARHLRGGGRQVTAITLASVALPFGLGAGLAALLYPWQHRTGSSSGLLALALFLGTAMAITAFPVLARIVAERGMQRNRIGALSLVCAAAQDAIAWCLLAVVVAVVTASGTWPLARMAAEMVVFALVLAYAVRPALNWLLAPQRGWRNGTSVAYPVIVCGLLLSCWATAEIGLHAIFGAFAFGVTVPRRHIERTAATVPRRIDETGRLLLPVFFTVTGLSVDMGGLGWKGLVELVAVVAVACAGKFVGAAGAARRTGLDRSRARALGVLLNARGLTELVILNVGLELKVLDSRMFTVMVIMALVTTVMTGPVLSRVYPQELLSLDMTPAHQPAPVREPSRAQVSSEVG